MSLLASIFNSRKGAISVDWTASLGSGISTQLSTGYLDEDSVVVGALDGNIYAIRSSGKIKWKHIASEALSKEGELFMENDGSQLSSPIIADIDRNGKGEVIFGSSDNLYALNCKGQPIWKFAAKGKITSPACVRDINNDKKPEVLFGSEDGNLYALSNSGKLLWTFKTGANAQSQPNVTNDGHIIFGTSDGTVYSLNGKGKKMWEFKANGPIAAQPSLGDVFNDGRVFIAISSLDNNIYLLSSQGKLEWVYGTEGKIFSSAVINDIDKDCRNEIIFGSCDDRLHILSPYGKKLWDFETDFWIVAQPIVKDIDNDGKNEIIVGSYDNSVYVIDAESMYSIEYMPGISSITGQSGSYTDLAVSQPGSYRGKALAKLKVDGFILSQSVLGDKSVVIATDKGKIYNLGYMSNA